MMVCEERKSPAGASSLLRQPSAGVGHMRAMFAAGQAPPGAVQSAAQCAANALSQAIPRVFAPRDRLLRHPLPSLVWAISGIWDVEYDEVHPDSQRQFTLAWERPVPQGIATRP